MVFSSSLGHVGDGLRRSHMRRRGLLGESISRQSNGKGNHTKTSNKSRAWHSRSGILSRYRKHLFLLCVCNEAADHRRVTQHGLNRNTSAGQRDSGDTKRDKRVRCRTVAQRIRSGGKREECTVREANAVEPQNRNEILRGTALPAAKQEYRSQPSPAHAESRERPATRSATVKQPRSSTT